MQALAEAGDLPLVLHGASGLPLDMIERAVRTGITKFNVNTEVRAAARAAQAASAADGADVLQCMQASTDAMVPVITEKLRMFAPPRA